MGSDSLKWQMTHHLIEGVSVTLNWLYYDKPPSDETRKLKLLTKMQRKVVSPKYWPQQCHQWKPGEFAKWRFKNNVESAIESGFLVLNSYLWTGMWIELKMCVKIWRRVVLWKPFFLHLGLNLLGQKYLQECYSSK